MQDPQKKKANLTQHYIKEKHLPRPRGIYPWCADMLQYMRIDTQKHHHPKLENKNQMIINMQTKHFHD